MELSAGLVSMLPIIPDQIWPLRRFQTHSQISNWLFAQTVVTDLCIRATRVRPSWQELLVPGALLWAFAFPVRLAPFPPGKA